MKLHLFSTLAIQFYLSRCRRLRRSCNDITRYCVLWCPLVALSRQWQSGTVNFYMLSRKRQTTKHLSYCKFYWSQIQTCGTKMRICKIYRQVQTLSLIFSLKLKVQQANKLQSTLHAVAWLMVWLTFDFKFFNKRLWQLDASSLERTTSDAHKGKTSKTFIGLAGSMRSKRGRLSMCDVTQCQWPQWSSLVKWSWHQ